MDRTESKSIMEAAQRLLSRGNISEGTAKYDMYLALTPASKKPIVILVNKSNGAPVYLHTTGLATRYDPTILFVGMKSWKEANQLLDRAIKSSYKNHIGPALKAAGVPYEFRKVAVVRNEVEARELLQPGSEERYEEVFSSGK